MMLEAGAALLKELFGKVASGELTADQATAEYEAQALAADVEIAKNQSAINLSESKSEHMIQWAWRPGACIALTVAVLVWPFASLLDALLPFVALTEAQMDNLRSVSMMMSPYWAGAMGLREYSKHRRQQGWISKIGELIKK